MVLKSILLSICCLLGINLVPSDGPLLTTYKSKIEKEVSSAFQKSKGTLSKKVHNKSIEIYNVTSAGAIIGYACLKEVKSCALNGCSKKSANNLGSEYYDIAVFTDLDKNIISIKVLDYFSDYGYEITSKRYLKKYREKSLCAFSTKQIPVDGISGATISYNALVSSLGEFCDLLQEK